MFLCQAIQSRLVVSQARPRQYLSISCLFLIRYITSWPVVYMRSKCDIRLASTCRATHEAVKLSCILIALLVSIQVASGYSVNYKELGHSIKAVLSHPLFTKSMRCWETEHWRCGDILSFLRSGNTNHTEALLAGVRQQNSRLLSHRGSGSSWSCSVDNNCPSTCTNQVIWPEKLLHGLKSSLVYVDLHHNCA